MFKTVKNNKRLGINSAKNVKLGGIYKILSGFVGKHMNIVVGNVGPTFYNYTGHDGIALILEVLVVFG